MTNRQALRACDRFNRRNRVGVTVWYRLHPSAPQAPFGFGKTVSPAMSRKTNTPVIRIAKEPGSGAERPITIPLDWIERIEA